MPIITVKDQQFALPPGQTRLGGGSAVDVHVGDDGIGTAAVVDLGADGRAVIRRETANAGVRVNGVLLGVEPIPLIHGDKIEIAGAELFFSDDSKSGATQFVSASDLASLTQKRTGAARATAATGGRLVSLVDGKEYAVPDAGLTIGRDAGATVVVAEREVSRVHAEILPAEGGYVIYDRSTNGLFVNGSKVPGSQLLSRADVIKAGTEEFRFYADAAAPIPKPVAPAPAPVAAPVPTPAGPPPAAPPAAPVPPRATVPQSGPLLATVEIIAEGPTKGTIFEIRTPLAHVGRGAHNDIVLASDSVSDTHAKIQRRDDGWYVVDAGSTNGTYVGGARITGEKRLEGAPDLRFGGIKTVFRAIDVPVVEESGTRVIAPIKIPGRPTTGTVGLPGRGAAPAEAPVAPPKKGIPVWVWIAVVVMVGGAVAFLLMGRTS